MAIDVFFSNPVLLNGKEQTVVRANSFGKSNGFIYLKNRNNDKFLWVTSSRIEQITTTDKVTEQEIIDGVR